MFRHLSDSLFVKKQMLISSVMGLTVLFLLSQISIPLRPVPITLQTVALMILALLFDKKAALTAVGSYLLLGAIGVPVFTGFKSGITVLMGPTGGYLFGFYISVWAMHNISEYIKDETFLSMLFICLSGTLVLYVCGVFWLSMLMMSFKKAFMCGVLPFIIPGIVKAFILVFLIKTIKKINTV